MGWDCFESERDTVTTARQCIGGDIVAVVDRGAVVYAAVREGGSVSAVVALLDHASTGSRGRRSYRVKLMGEREGPMYWDAPAEFLALLSPAPAGSYAETWRRRCRDKAAGVDPRAEVVAQYRRA
jgi:hypothetical protein